jgi:transcriptional regulator with XRE-family HTH domain
MRSNGASIEPPFILEQPVVRLSRLRALRERAALTQAELAQQAHVTRNTVMRLEAGAYDPRPGTIRKLARALGVRPAELMPRDETS